MTRFFVSYPCYIVLRPSGWPDFVNIDDERKAVSLFTDKDLAEHYCRAKRAALRKHGGQFPNEFGLVRVSHAEGLLAALHQIAERGMHFVAIDPTPGKTMVTRVALDTFMDDLERTL